MSGALTLFESPSLLVKRWYLDTNGQPVKESAGQMSSGRYCTSPFDSVSSLGDLLNNAGEHQAASSSLASDGSVSGIITTKRNWKPGTLTRSKRDFNLRPAPGVLFLDHDAAAGERGMDREELWSLLATAVPALAEAGVVWRPSGSSFIYHGDREITGLKGQHLAVMVLDASDGPRVTKVLDARLWLAGFG